MKMYILVGHTPFEAEDAKEWAIWFEHSAHERRVALDQLALLEVSTVFTGLDYGMGVNGGLPLLFETAVFNETALHARHVPNAVVGRGAATSTMRS